LNAAEARAALRGHAAQSQEIAAENAAAFQRALAYRNAQNRKYGRQDDGSPSPRIGV